MNVVVAADQFTAPDYSATKTGSLGPGQFVSHYFNVPAGTPAFKVDMTGGGAPGAGAIPLPALAPVRPWCSIPTPSAAATTVRVRSRAALAARPAGRYRTRRPECGEGPVDARRNSDAVSAPFTLSASILGATVSPNPDVIASATIGVPIARSYDITNLYGAFTGRAVGTGLGSAYVATPSIANHAQQQYDVTVAAGSTSLRATIGGTSDPGADLDLFVYNCTSGSCVLAGQSADGVSEESVTISNPAAGLWRVLVDGYAVPPEPPRTTTWTCSPTRRSVRCR